jgi:hypothetical protein
MNDTMTAATLRSDILDAGRQLQDAIKQNREASVEYIRAKYEWESAKAAVYLRAKGTIPEREARVLLDTGPQRLAHDEALERKRATKLDVEAMQSIVSGFQTIAANARAEQRWAQTGPEVGP